MQRLFEQSLRATPEWLGTEPFRFEDARALNAFTATPYLLGDAGVDPAFFRGAGDLLYTTEAAAQQAGGNMERCTLNPLLDVSTGAAEIATYNAFKMNGGSFTVTGPWDDEAGSFMQETVSLQTSSGALSAGTTAGEFPECWHCGNSTIVKLTAGEDCIYLCNDVVSNTTDFSLAVQAVAFSSTFTLVTEDGGLGTALRAYEAYSPWNGFWINYKRR